MTLNIHSPNRAHRRPRFLTVIPDLGFAGAERVTANLLNAMRPELFDYHLVTLTEYENQYQVPDHVNWKVLHSPRVETAAWALARHIRALKPDVICSHIVSMNICTAMSCALSRVRPRLVMVEHHVATQAIVSDTSTKGTGMLHNLLVPAMRWTYPRADKIVGVSSAVLQETLRVTGVDASKGVVIPNPVVFSDFEARSAEPADHRWLDDPSYEVILGVGRLIPFKNFSLLIDAFARIAPHRPRARLVICGDGYLRPALEAQIKERGLEDRAELVGLRPNPYSAMRRAGVVAVTSFTEGLSTVLIEAMACGTPVVATDFASARETLPSCAHPPVALTPDAVADAIVRVLSRPRETEQLKAFAAGFSINPVARRYEQVLLSVLPAGEPAAEPQGVAGASTPPL